MSNSSFSHEEIVREGKLSAEDMTEIKKRRRDYNRLGYAYQLAFVRLASRFPAQQPLEINRELLTYVGMQLSIPDEALERYQNRQQTMAEHRTAILAYQGCRRFREAEQALLEAFLFEEAGRLEQTGPLLVRARQFLKEEAILFPAKDTLQRLIARQRQKAREYIYARVSAGLDGDFVVHLEALLVAGDNRLTPFQTLKNPPGRASPAAMLRLAEKLASIEKTGLLHVDLAWLNNNYQRSLARYAWRCSADRMRRHAALVCFLGQVYRDTLDYMIDMHHKLLLRISQRAQEEMDDQTRKQRRMIRSSLATLHTLSLVLLDENILDGELRRTLFERVDKEQLTLQMTEVATWLTGKYSHVFNLVVARFAYLRQFAPVFLKHLDFRLEEGVQSSVIEAIRLLREMNAENRRKLSADAPLDFIPQKLRPLVEMDGTVNKRAW